MSLLDDMIADVGPVQVPSAAPSNAPAYPYQAIDQAAEQRYGLPQGTLGAISAIESNHTPDVTHVNTNGTTDYGRFQINSTNRGMNGNDPDQAAQLFRGYLDQAGGDMSRAVAMYNAGPNSQHLNSQQVQNYVRRFNTAFGQYSAQPVTNVPLSGTQNNVSALSGLAKSMNDDINGTVAQNGAIIAPNATGTAPPSTGFSAGLTSGAQISLSSIKQALDMAASGIGKTAIGQAVDNIGQKLGFPSVEQSAQATNQYMAQHIPGWQASGSTITGQIGQIAGQMAVAAPAALIPGANTAIGAGIIGAGLGALTTQGNINQRAVGAGLGAAGGAAGSLIGRGISAGAGMLSNRLATSAENQAAASAGTNEAANIAGKYGLKINPSDLNPGPSLVTGLSGSSQINALASSKNQAIVNQIVKSELGVPDNVPLNSDTLSGIRQQAGNAYNVIRNLGTITPGDDYHMALDNILKNTTGQARSFPGLKNNEIEDTLNILKQPSFDAGDAVDATRFLRNMADKAYRSGDNQVGSAYKQASGALEDALWDNVAGTGNYQLMNGFQAARQTIAKTYSVEKALNDTTGNIDAGNLAGQLRRGAPLSGGLLDIAKVSSAFPKSMQSLKTQPSMAGPLDYGLGALGSIASGDVLGAAVAAARPLARYGVLSAPYQGLQRSLATHHYLMDLVTKGAKATAANPEESATLGGLAGINSQDRIQQQQ